MIRLREKLAMALLAIASRLLPLPKRPNGRRIDVGRMTITTFHVHPSAKSAADVLRDVAENVDDGVVQGFRVVWNGVPSQTQVLLVAPRAIGEA